MGIFDFFRGKKIIESGDEVGKIDFEEIEKWLDGKEKDLKKSEREALEDIGERLKRFYISLEEKLEVLGGIDIESKKEYERAKILVRQGLDKYVGFVRVLLKDLKDLEKKDLEKFIREVSGKFILFEKTSARVYERATYLVGDEMAAVRNEIRRFYNGLVEIFEKKESLIKNLKRGGNVRLKLVEFEKVRGSLKDIEKEIKIDDLRIEKVKKKIDGLNDEIERIRESSEYVSNLKIEAEIKNLQIGLDNEVGKLKEMIDFKKLTGVVHKNERELRIVKDYREHFVSEFTRDGGKKILKLLSDCNMKSARIEAQVLLIGKKNCELKGKRGKVGLDVSVVKLGEVKRNEDEIDGLENGKVKSKRRLEEFGLKLKGLKNEVIGLIEGFGVEVV
jgi:hypothetical protein